MLRTLVALLLLANAGFFAWHQGWLDGVVGASVRQQGREPERLKQQIDPERLIVVAPVAEAAASVPTASSSPAAASEAMPATASSGAAAASVALSSASVPAGGENVCREAGPFTPEEFKQASAVLNQRLPAGSWTSQTVAVQGLWLVYMGPYPDQDTYQRKQAELRHIRGITFEEVRSPAKLAMGLSLGRFSNEAQAQASLEAMKLRGVRTAYVVNVRPTMDFSVVRVAQAGPELQHQLPGLPLPSGKGFAPCPP